MKKKPTEIEFLCLITFFVAKTQPVNKRKICLNAYFKHCLVQSVSFNFL